MKMLYRFAVTMVAIPTWLAFGLFLTIAFYVGISLPLAVLNIGNVPSIAFVAIAGLAYAAAAILTCRMFRRAYENE